MCVIIFTLSAQSQVFGSKTRQKVSAVTGLLTLHPDSVTIKGSDGKLYYFFLDVKNECLLITNNSDIYKSFSEFLPKQEISGRQIEIEATPISPFTLFSKSQLKAEGRKLGLKLNKYKLCKIFNYSLKNGSIIQYKPSGY